LRRVLPYDRTEIPEAPAEGDFIPVVQSFSFQLICFRSVAVIAVLFFHLDWQSHPVNWIGPPRR
jgi:hypothetical protein